MPKTLTPLFLVSLPRSGSTLAQRIISAHPKVTTTAEPWLLLPLYSALERTLCRTKYGQRWLYEAVNDFNQELPGGLTTYHTAVATFAYWLYGAIANKNDADYFLDKTPRYHLVIHHVLSSFPRGKFIILWRNPLAVLASQIKSYGGVWRYHHFHVDLFDGLANLIEVYRTNSDRICAVRYEDMIIQPEKTFRRIFDYIGLTYESRYLDVFAKTSVSGRMGDKTGTQEFHAISNKPIQKWKGTLTSPLRRLWCRRYLNWIGEERMKVMGYDCLDLLNQLDSLPITWNTVASDVARLIYGKLVLWRYGGML